MHKRSSDKTHLPQWPLCVALTLALGMASSPLLSQDSQESLPKPGSAVELGDTDNMWKMIQENWTELSHKAVTRWDAISEDEFLATEGRRDALVDLVAESYDKEPVIAQTEVDAWALSLNATE